MGIGGIEGAIGSPITSTPQQEIPCASFHFFVTAIDQAGNESLPTEEHTLSLLTQCGGDGTFGDRRHYPVGEPVTSLVTGPDVDWVQIPSPFTIENLDEGPHTFYVRAVDEAGNVDPDPEVYPWIVDTLAPFSPSPLEVVTGDDEITVIWAPSGDGGGSGVSGHLVYSLQGVPPVFVPGAAVDRYVLTVEIPCASFRFFVTAIDQAGNESLPTEELPPHIPGSSTACRRSRSSSRDLLRSRIQRQRPSRS